MFFRLQAYCGNHEGALRLANVSGPLNRKEIKITARTFINDLCGLREINTRDT
jgi:hypothetical protein